MLLRFLVRCRTPLPPKRSFFSTTATTNRRNYPRSPIKPAGSLVNNVNEEAEAKRLMGAIEHFMRLTLQEKQFETFIHKQIEHGAKSIASSRIVAVLETVIGFLVDNNRLREAASVYLRLKNDGLVPSAPTDADMLVISLSMSDTHADPAIIDGLMLAISSPTFSETNLRRTLHLMGRLHLPSRVVVDTIDRFLCSREGAVSPQVVAELVDVQIQAGQYNAAMQTVKAFQPESGDSAAAHVYGTALEALIREDPHSSQPVDDVLQVMGQRGVYADFRIFNALIRRQIRLRSWSTVFAIYKVMIHSTKLTGVIPDPRTFVMLFHAHEELARQTKRTPPKSRKIKSARGVFHDMLSTFFNAKSPRHREDPVPSILSMMHMAIRTFLAQRDFAAAYVALATFDKLNIPVTFPLYRYVIRSLALYTQADIVHTNRWPKNRLKSSWWAYVQFGLMSLTSDSLRALSEHDAISAKLLLASNKSDLHMKPTTDIALVGDPSHTVNPGAKPIYVPSWKAVLNPELVSAKIEASLTTLPLLRLTKRALLASLGDVSPLVADTKERQAAGTRAVSQQILEAKEAMIPKGQQYFVLANDQRSWYNRPYLEPVRHKRG